MQSAAAARCHVLPGVEEVKLWIAARDAHLPAVRAGASPHHKYLASGYFDPRQDARASERALYGTSYTSRSMNPTAEAAAAVVPTVGNVPVAGAAPACSV